MGASAEKMIFIVGNSRSGTTMLGRILGLNSGVHTFGELHFFEQLVDADDLTSGNVWPKDKALDTLERLLTRARDGFFADFSPEKYRTDAQDILGNSATFAPADIYAEFMASEARRNGKALACEQTPRYLFMAEEILQTYPQARMINLIRDPRDVVLSQRSKWKRRFLGGSGIPLREAIRAWSNYHPWLVSRLWVGCVDYAFAMRNDRFLSIRFEDLVAEPEKEVRAICDFADLRFEPEMLEIPHVGSSSGHDTPDKRGIDGGRASGWRKSGMSTGLRSLCEWACYDRMKRHGYKDFLIDGRFSLRILAYMLVLPLKLPLAVAFNLKRFARLSGSIRRRFKQKAPS